MQMTKVAEVASSMGLDVADIAHVAAGDAAALARVGRSLGIDPDILVAVTALSRKVRAGGADPAAVGARQPAERLTKQVNRMSQRSGRQHLVCAPRRACR